LPEDEIHSRSAGSTPYEMGHDPKKYPLERILATAELAAGFGAEAIPKLRQALGDPDSAVRFWGATGLLARGRPAVEPARADLRKALADAAPSVRITAAEALAAHGAAEDLQPSLATLAELADAGRNGVFAAIRALIALDELGSKAAPVLAAVKDAGRTYKAPNQRLGEYVPRLVESIVARLEH
jgi:uncharacterized sulfatase